MTEQPGPAVRAVLAEYERKLRTHRRWSKAERAITAVLAVGTVWALVAGGLGFAGVLHVPWYLAYSPLPLLVVWLYRRQDLLERLGVPRAPSFPQAMIEIAAAADAQAATPRPFGSLPPTMRVHNPEHW